VRRAFVWAGLIACVGLGALAKDAAPPKDRPVRDLGAEYIGSESCRECHRAEHASWHKSFHRTMTQVAAPGVVVAPWKGVLEHGGRKYELETRDDGYWVKLDAREWKAEAGDNGKLRAGADLGKRVWKKIALTTGSHHQQVFHFPLGEGRKLRLFPFTWLIPEQRWIPYVTSFLGAHAGAEQTDVWNEGCIKCHATGGKPRRDGTTGRLDTTVVEFGIACEACHGPGAKHVAFERTLEGNEDDREALATGDPTIIHPAKLSAKTGAMVCGQCHSVYRGRTNSHDQLWWLDGFSYRPGDNLNITREVIRRPVDAGHPLLKNPITRGLLESSFWSDGAVRVAGREYNGLIESPCYRGGNFSCLSCHSLHKSDPNDQLAAEMDGDEACLQCHDKMRGKVAEHTHHGADSSGSRCQNCHMPYTSYGLFKAIRSHKISSPSVQESVMHGRPNACNLCHLDQTLQWTAGHLVKWYGYGEPELDAEQRERSAVAVWLLRGDAGQRALAAWHFGWEPARRASGEAWLAPLLSEALADPYSAVRFIAQRSLKRLPGYADFEYDFVGTDFAAARKLALARWGGAKNRKLDARALLLDGSGGSDAAAVADLVKRRDKRPIYLAE